MKKITIFAASLFLLFSVSCKKDNNNPNPNATIVESGKWIITKFVDDNVNETANLAAYDFTFNSNGNVSAVSSANTMNGTWSLGTDDSKQKFNLDFASPSSFEELSEDWLILQINASAIQLTHTSGGNNFADTLFFGKK
ncbi:MAG TPA: hypothetical protein VKT28_19265 [Puia sp.]|nr:hypothetical protein [Puia sp.]